MGAFLNSLVELSKNNLELANAESRLPWNISVANMVDIAVACLIDFATASSSLERVATDIDSCCRHKYAAEENKSAWELIATSLRALFSHASKFFLQEMNIFPC